MKIACLGWGSLMWNPAGRRQLEISQPGTPRRICPAIRQRPHNACGNVRRQGVPVLWAELAVSEIAQAKAALAYREVSSRRISLSVGYWSRRDSGRQTQTATVGAWAASHNLDGVVWTALRPADPPVSAASYKPESNPVLPADHRHLPPHLRSGTQSTSNDLFVDSS